MITGLAALRRQGVRVPQSELVDVLVPATAQRQSTDFVRVHRTTRMPQRPWIDDGLRWAPIARAVGDASRGRIDLRDVRAIVADAVQRRKCTAEQLTSELLAGPKQGSYALRTAIEEVIDGVRSATEGDLRTLIKRGRVPEAMYNARLYVGSEFLAQPDAYWPEAGVAGEVDSREWHLSPEGWANTLARHARMSAQGIFVLHFTPARLRADAAQVLAEIKSTIEAGKQRPRLKIRAFPAAGPPDRTPSM